VCFVYFGGTLLIHKQGLICKVFGRLNFIYIMLIQLSVYRNFCLLNILLTDTVQFWCRIALYCCRTAWNLPLITQHFCGISLQTRQNSLNLTWNTSQNCRTSVRQLQSSCRWKTLNWRRGLISWHCSFHVSCW